MKSLEECIKSLIKYAQAQRLKDSWECHWCPKDNDFVFFAEIYIAYTDLFQNPLFMIIDAEENECYRVADSNHFCGNGFA